ncbi:MAG: IS4 family transposase [Methanomicrobiaceae archaeon]|nr:IS4 family transposase [Methanomicrobiaceae archaeon]
MDFDENWKLLLQFLPEGWEQQAQELGAIVRRRKILSAERLLRILLIHLADGCSMRETVVRAREADLADISDVALFKRLKASSEWLRWLSVNLADQLHGPVHQPRWLQEFTVRLVDASVITEPGSTGSDWRLHYSIELFGLSCDHFQITDQTVGESFRNFPVKQGDLLIGDRGYGSIAGINYVLDHEGDFLVRLRSKAFTLMANDRDEFQLLEQFRTLDYGEVGDFELFYTSNNHLKPIRVCVLKKAPDAAERSKKAAVQGQIKKQRPLNEETLELQEYVVVATSLTRDQVAAGDVMALYRLRWQVELAFKRLKSILGLGHLPKTDPVSAQAWLHGKMLVALLAAAIVDEGRRFSPWGYPLHGSV